VLSASSASASTQCKKATSAYKNQTLRAKSVPGLTEKNAFLKTCKPSKSKSVVNCAQAWEIEIFTRQQDAVRMAQQIVLNNKTCFDPALVAKIQISREK
jgi:hypothetical protein